jgi:hypothetical protein
MRIAVVVFVLDIICVVGHVHRPCEDRRVSYLMLGMSDGESLEHVVGAHEWRAPDGSGLGINRQSALNPTIGLLARKLYVDVDSVLLHPSPVNVSVPGELYLYALRDNDDISFDSILVGGDRYKLMEEEVSLERLLMNMAGIDSVVAFLAELAAAGLGKEVDQEILSRAVMGSKCGKKEEHMRMIGEMVKYLSRPEDSYVVEGEVDINKFLGSKTFLMQAILNKYIGKGYVGRFYDVLYERVRSSPGIVERYYSSGPADGGYEELMKRDGLSFPWRKGMFLAQLDPELVGSGCDHHESHDTVGLGDTSECAILSLLCVAFYDPESKGYTTRHLPGAKEELKRFFAQHPRPFKYSEVEEEWSRVVESLRDGGIKYKAERGEDRIVPTVENVCRAIGELCGMERGDGREMAAAICEKLVVSRYRDGTGVLDMVERIVPLSSVLKFPLGGVMCIDVRSLVGTDYVRARIVCSEEKIRFEMAECTCLRGKSVGCGSIVDYLSREYLRHYHNKQRMDTVLGRGGYEYEGLILCGKEQRDRYIGLCLDRIIESSNHPRLQQIRDLVVRHRSGLVQEVFAAAVKGEEYDITKDVVGSVGMNLLKHMVEHSSEALSKSVVSEVIGAAASNGRRDIVEWIGKSVSRDGMKEGFVRGFCLVVRDTFAGHFDRVFHSSAAGVDQESRAYRYGMVLEEYCADGAVTPEVEREAAECCYEYSFRRLADSCSREARDDCLMVFPVYVIPAQLDTRMFWSYLCEFFTRRKTLAVQKGSEYLVIGKVLSKIVMENLDVPCDLFDRMQQLCEKELRDEVYLYPPWRECLEYIVKMLFDIEHESLIERNICQENTAAEMTE